LNSIYPAVLIAGKIGWISTSPPSHGNSPGSPAVPDIRASLMSESSLPVPENPCQSMEKESLNRVPVTAVLIALLILNHGIIFNPGTNIARAYTAMQNLNSYRFTVSRTGDPEGVNSTFEANLPILTGTIIKYGVNEKEQEIILLAMSSTIEVILSQILNFKPIRIPDADPRSDLEWLDMLTDIRELPEEKHGRRKLLHYQGAYDYAKDIRNSKTKEPNRVTSAKRRGIRTKSAEYVLGRGEDHRSLDR